jgi:hypothetical protein
MLPPGWARPATASIGSPIAAMTIGMGGVAAFAAGAAGVPRVTMMSTCARTCSAASAGKRSPAPSAERYSNLKSSPSK